MVQPPAKIRVYLEVGSQRTFAGAIDWPGWSRSGRDELSALGALIACGPRYARVLQAAQLDDTQRTFLFSPPTNISEIVVTERLKGSSTTDFGSPAVAPSVDEAPVSDEELRRLAAVLEACWQAFAAAVEAAQGKELRKGPRGGGRDRTEIVQHVIEANRAYLDRIGCKLVMVEDSDPQQEVGWMLEESLKALAGAAAGELPLRGPRGGVRWTPRHFVRRAAWHVLDHAWEIEDRAL